LLCFVHAIVPLVVALGDEHVEELLLMNGGWFILPQSGFVQQLNQRRRRKRPARFIKDVIHLE